MDEKIVRIYAQRHGEKNGDALTEKGVQQIAHSRAAGALAGISFSGFYASPMHRAQHTAAIVAGSFQEVKISYGLYPPMTNEQSEYLWDVAQSNLKPGATVSDWFKALPSGWGARMQSHLQGAFAEMCREAIRHHPDQEEWNVYAAGHSPVLEFALPEEAMTMPPLGLADVLVITCEVSDEAFAIIDVEYHPYSE